MIKRTIEVSQSPAHLSVKHKQLVIQARGQHERDAPTVPCEDIGLVIVDERQTTWSNTALATLMDFGAAVLVCGHDHLPAGMLLPLAGHNEVVTRLHQQMATSKPLKKQLWKQIVVAKIRAQAANLEGDSRCRGKLLALARTVKSGDPTNVEAHAAKLYWGAWLKGHANTADGKFRRDPDGDPPNNFLNYGYAVMRALVARALVGAGLSPVLGLHHCNRRNAFCLADDLVEPLRPIVDARARDLLAEGKTELDRETKAALLELVAVRSKMEDASGPLMVNVQRMVSSLVRCYAGGSRSLEIPVAC